MGTAPPRRFERPRQKQGKHHGMYGAEWRKAREYWLAEHPLCIECERRGLVVQATDVDHVKRHDGDRELFWDRENWQSLCKECHDRKTARERA